MRRCCRSDLWLNSLLSSMRVVSFLPQGSRANGREGHGAAAIFNHLLLQLQLLVRLLVLVCVLLLLRNCGIMFTTALVSHELLFGSRGEALLLVLLHLLLLLLLLHHCDALVLGFGRVDHGRLLFITKLATVAKLLHGLLVTSGVVHNGRLFFGLKRSIIRTVMLKNGSFLR